MKKQNEQGSKNKWGQMIQKKWFLPAVYLTIAAVMLTVVVWYQNIGNQVPDAQQDIEGEYVPNLHDKDAKPVADQQEMIQMPLKEADQAEIVTKFYDYEAEEKEQQNGLILFNNRFYQSTGIGISKEDKKSFDVVASLTGEVVEVKEDPLLGNVVVMSHQDDVKTYYASLGDVEVDAGQKIKQGETLGTAGKSLFTKENGIHVHFELRKNNVKVNPEDYFNQPLSKLDDVKAEEAEKEEEESAKEEDSAKHDESKSDKPSHDTDINIDTEEDESKSSESTKNDSDDKTSEEDKDAEEKDDQSTDEKESSEDKSKKEDQ